ncbi:peptidoglycan editing factor PgeF [Paenibacillus senegalensis]|uniref:peptidoglycan editing factor PgeF n=1 Tax=Paenibacillus senegalensis TaxID=1465766 RepID=UPI000287F253|nr:peptidoglycan editing factor PgeF [Paenibacillus senegalensis]
MEPFQYVEEPNRPALFYLRSWMEQFPGLTAGITSRHGGVSSTPYASLNMGLHVGDRPADVTDNRNRAADSVGLSLSSWVFAEQVHGINVSAVGAHDRGKGTVSRENEVPSCDALMTDQPQLVLAALFADCVPLYFVDPSRQAIAIAHAGWKGTVGRIAMQVVDSMRRHYGSAPGDLYAAIGPSIRACCYEVDERVAEPVRSVLSEIAEDSSAGRILHSCLTDRKSGGKYSLDLQLVNRQIMIKAGISPSRIEMTTWCTSCHVEQLYSHRKESGLTGRMCAWIGWRRQEGENRN